MWLALLIAVHSLLLSAPAPLRVALSAGSPLIGGVKDYQIKSGKFIKLVSYDDPYPIMLNIQFSAPAIDLYELTYNEGMISTIDVGHEAFFEPIDEATVQNLPANLLSKLQKNGPVYRIPVAVEQKTFMYRKDLRDLMKVQPSADWFFDQSLCDALPNESIWVQDLEGIIVLAYFYCLREEGCATVDSVAQKMQRILPKLYLGASDIMSVRRSFGQKKFVAWILSGQLELGTTKLEQAAFFDFATVIRWLGISRFSGRKKQAQHFVRCIMEEKDRVQSMKNVAICHDGVDFNIIRKVQGLLKLK